MLISLVQAMKHLMRLLRMSSYISCTKMRWIFGAGRKSTMQVLFSSLHLFELNAAQAILNSYGDWFFERRDYRHASAGNSHHLSSQVHPISNPHPVFIEAGSLKKAMVSQERDLEWRDLFDLAYRTSMPLDEIQSMAYRISGTDSLILLVVLAWRLSLCR